MPREDVYYVFMELRPLITEVAALLRVVHTLRYKYARPTELSGSSLLYPIYSSYRYIVQLFSLAPLSHNIARVSLALLVLTTSYLNISAVLSEYHVTHMTMAS